MDVSEMEYAQFTAILMGDEKSLDFGSGAHHSNMIHELLMLLSQILIVRAQIISNPHFL